MGISVKMVVAMMMEAGMGENAIVDALHTIKPIATYEGAPYFDPTTVSRFIKKNAI